MPEHFSRKVSAFIVEDDEHIGALLKFILEREHCTVYLAKDGREAERYIESQPPPELAVFDIMIPHADGYQLIHKVRTHPQWCDVPLLMLSAKTSENAVVRALDLGANDYIVKPFQPNELKARIRRLVRGIT